MMDVSLDIVRYCSVIGMLGVQRHLYLRCPVKDENAVTFRTLGLKFQKSQVRPRMSELRS